MCVCVRERERERVKGMLCLTFVRMCCQNKRFFFPQYMPYSYTTSRMWHKVNFSSECSAKKCLISICIPLFGSVSGIEPDPCPFKREGKCDLSWGRITLMKISVNEKQVIVFFLSLLILG